MKIKKKKLKIIYYYKDDNISKISIIIDYQIKSFSKLFYCCKCIKSIKFKKL